MASLIENCRFSTGIRAFHRRDGTPGDDYALAGSVANGLYRLNGDGAINAFDFSQFRTRFGSGVP